MHTERPDLTGVSPEILAYIEALEAEVAAQMAPQSAQTRPARQDAVESAPEPSEPPTTVNVITISTAGMAKRTPRHLYGRQRRGGMGIFDLDTPEDQPPALLTIADESQYLILFTDQGHTYRLPVNQLPESPVRAKGTSVSSLIALLPGERIVAALPETADEAVALVGERGWVTSVKASFVGKSMIPGVSYFDTTKRGPLAAACWLPSINDDIFIATRQGIGIRFVARRIPTNGCLGIRLAKGDVVSAAAPANDDSGVFLMSGDGKGTIRLMQGFTANKSPGGGGKVALKTDHLVSAAPVDTSANATDLFVISRNSKIIRFQVDEVPPKTGVVQGVNCISLRADEVAAVVAAKL